MNTAPQYHSGFFCVAPLQSKVRNGMEEVVGSIPTRSTIISIQLAPHHVTCCILAACLALHPSVPNLPIIRRKSLVSCVKTLLASWESLPRLTGTIWSFSSDGHGKRKS